MEAASCLSHWPRLLCCCRVTHPKSAHMVVGELETGRSSGDLDLVDRTITLLLAEILTGSGRGKVVCVGLPCPSSPIATMIIIKIVWNT